jgi:nitrogenase subunit NifH
MEKQQATETNMENLLASETGMEVISAIPCYCDIQFSRKEFLTVLDQPEHPFAKQIKQLIHAVETIQGHNRFKQFRALDWDGTTSFSKCLNIDRSDNRK